MIQNLRSIVVEQLLANFLQLVALLFQLGHIGYGNALDVFHDQHRFAAELAIDLRARNEAHVLVQACEFLQIVRFNEKVGFLQKRRPQLFDNIVQIEHLVALHHARGPAGKRTHNGDILRHLHAHARTLDLYRHHFPADKAGLVNLGKRSRPQGLGVDGIEQLVHALGTEFVFERLAHLLIR
jgi:hypothetical protein